LNPWQRNLSSIAYRGLSIQYSEGLGFDPGFFFPWIYFCSRRL